MNGWELSFCNYSNGFSIVPGGQSVGSSCTCNKFIFFQCTTMSRFVDLLNAIKPFLFTFIHSNFQGDFLILHDEWVWAQTISVRFFETIKFCEWYIVHKRGLLQSVNIVQ